MHCDTRGTLKQVIQSWEGFRRQWRDTTLALKAAVDGRDAFRSQKRRVVREALAQYADCGFVAVAVEPRFRVPITSANIDKVIDSHCRYTIKRFDALLHGQALVLHHASFEKLLTDLCAVAIIRLRKADLLSRYGSMQVSLSDAMTGTSTQSVRQRLLKDLRLRWTLSDRLNFLVSVCQASDSIALSEISEEYQHSLDAIKAADTSRQRLMHQVAIHRSYRSEGDVQAMLNAARFAVHAVANCIFQAGIGFIDLHQIDGGVARIHNDRFYARHEETLATLTLEQDGEVSPRLILLSTERPELGCALYVKNAGPTEEQLEGVRREISDLLAERNPEPGRIAEIKAKLDLLTSKIMSVDATIELKKQETGG